MVELARKYRPRRFQDLVGQTDAVAWMKTQIRSRERSSLLLAGPIGTGKSTLGRIYARAVLCSAPQDGEACGACDTCREFGDRGEDLPDVSFVKCGENGGIEKMQEVLDVARTPPFYAERRVLILDEAHNLSRRSPQALLDILEQPPQWVTFILLTSEKHDLPPSLLSRLQCLDLELIKQAESLSFLASICRREGKEFEPAALDLIFHAVGGSPRQLLRALEKMGGPDAITEANVRAALRLDFDGHLGGYVNALLDGDLARQLQSVEHWSDTPDRKLGYLHQFFTFQYLKDVRRLQRDDPLMRTVPDTLQSRLMREFAARAAKLKIDADAFWQDALAVLEEAQPRTQSQLVMILSRFDRLINGSPSLANGDAKGKAPIHARPPRLRVLLEGQEKSEAQSAYLSWAEIHPIWEIGSFLPQQFGVLFNVRLTIHHRKFGFAQLLAGTRLVSDLTHELKARIAWWEPNSLFHWVYRHETDADGDLVSRILLAVPDRQLAPSLHWLRRFVARRAGSTARDNCAENGFSASCRPGARKADRVHFHWQGIRALSRGLDPAHVERDEEGVKRPLVDLLGIPMRWRSPVGNVATSQGMGASKGLTRNVRRRVVRSYMPVLSALRERAWHHVASGWELDEHCARLAEAARRESAITQVNLRFPGEDALSVARRNEELDSLRAIFSRDPKTWSRSWIGWWQPSGNELRGR